MGPNACTEIASANYKGKAQQSDVVMTRNAESRTNEDKQHGTREFGRKRTTEEQEKKIEKITRKKKP